MELLRNADQHLHPAEIRRGGRLLFRTVLALLCLFLMSSCRKDRGEDEAAQMALKYYNHLVAGEYDAYLQGLRDYEQMPPSYREELKALLAQYVRKELEDRQGFARVTINSDTIIGQQANVFLEIEFKDGTKEEVAVPMVYCGDVWKLQ